MELETLASLMGSFYVKVDFSERKRPHLSRGLKIFEIRPPRAERRAWKDEAPETCMSQKVVISLLLLLPLFTLLTLG